MTPMRTLLLTLTAAAVNLFGADPALLRLAPADAAFIAGIHTDQIKTSRFGQFLLDQLKSEEANMSRFISATGFDPRRDLTELVVVSSDARGKGKTLVLAKGRFDMNRIQSFVQAEGSVVTNYNGVSIFGGKHPGSHGSLAVLDATTAVAGDTETLKLSIDRFRNTSPSVMDPKLVNKITELSNRYDAWMVSASLARLAEDFRDPNVGGAMGGNLMKSMESVLGGVRFGANVEVMAEAQMRSEKDATAMVDVVKFLGGMLQMNGNDPRAGEIAELLDKMELMSTGTQFRMSLTIPEDMLEKLVKPAANRRNPII